MKKPELGTMTQDPNWIKKLIDKEKREEEILKNISDEGILEELIKRLELKKPNIKLSRDKYDLEIITLSAGYYSANIEGFIKKQK